MITEGDEVKFVNIVREFDSYVLDSQWTFTYTGQNILTIRDKQLKEEYYNHGSQKF